MYKWKEETNLIEVMNSLRFIALRKSFFFQIQNTSSLVWLCLYLC